MKLGNRYSQHSFAQIPNVNIARSKFDRSFSAKTTFDFDYLTPCFVDEILPGDTVNLNVKTFMRLATQIVPFMDNAYVDFFFFFVPNRLVWNNWERFNGAQDDPGDSTDFLIPQIEGGHASTGYAVGSMFDQFGIPTGVPAISVNALPFRAYNLIFNEWFRDQNLESSRPVSKGDGPDSYLDYTLQRRAKKHDYFTSCLPWPQKGDPVSMAITGEAPVVTNGNNPAMIGLTSSVQRNMGWSAAVGLQLYGGGTMNDGESVIWGGETGMKTDANLGTLAIAINDFRQAMMMQSLLELDARGGTRYTEILRAHFGVVSPDARLQRPEFLSGGTIHLNQHPVAQNSATSETGTPQANLASFGTVAESGNRIGFSKSFVEHGYVIGLMQARADITYQQGLNKMWSRQTRWDFFWPKFQELGEQAVLNQEIYVGGVAPTDVFGYQERYAEYRYRPSEIRGQFRSTFAQSLDVWHLAEEFPATPALNFNFIRSSTPIERNLALEDYPHLKADLWFDYKHARPMMTYGVPATLGRF